MENMARIFQAAFHESTRDARQRALRMVTLCVGGMVLARTTDDPKLKREVRDAARTQALALLDEAVE
jgi:hypothetical protein